MNTKQNHLCYALCICVVSLSTHVVRSVVVFDLNRFDTENRSRLAHTYLRIRRKGELNVENNSSGNDRSRSHPYSAYSHFRYTSFTSFTSSSARCLRVKNEWHAILPILNIFSASPAHHCPCLSLYIFFCLARAVLYFLYCPLA